MADELGSKLGFDVSAAIASLNQLKKEFDSYSANLLKVAGSTEKFNKEQGEVDKLLVASSAGAERAARAFKQYATDANKAEAAARQFLNVQKDMQKTFATSRTGPLVGRTEAAFAKRDAGIDAAKAAEAAAFQERADAKAIAAFNEKVRFQNTLRDAERQRNAESFAAIDRQIAAQRQLSQSTKIPLADDVRNQSEEIKKRAEEIGISWKGVLKIFATQIAFNAIGALTRALREGIQAAVEYELKLAAIQTISKEFAARGLDQTSAAVRRLSDEFGRPITEVATALYDALSNQIGNAGDATLFLDEALKLSRATMASTADTGNLLSGVINAYGLTVSSAANISDQFFVAIDRGRVSADKIADTFGRITPLAATLGISLTDINTAFAELTIQGVKESDAITQLTNVMLKLIKPTEELQAVFDRLGIASAEAGIAMLGFDGFLRVITKDAGQSATEIGKLFNQIRGTRGVLGIITRDSDKYAQTLRAIQDASKGVGATAEAANKILETPAAQLQKQLEQLRNFLIDDFGRSAIAFFNSFTKNVLSLKNAFLILASGVAAVGSVFTAGGLLVLVNQFGQALVFLNKTLLATGVSAQTAAAGLSRFAFVLGGVGVALGAVALTRFLSQLRDGASEAERAAEKIRESFQKLTEQQIADLRPQIDARKKAVAEAIAETLKQSTKIQQAYLKDKENAFELQRSITAQMKDQLQERSTLLDQFLSKLRTVQKDSQKNIKDIQQKAFDTQFDQNARKFERDLATNTGEAQISALLTRSAKVFEAAKKAFRSGDQEQGNKLLNEAFDLANRVAEIPAARARGEAQVNKLLQEQKSLTNEMVEAERQRAAQAADVEKRTKATVLLTAERIAELQAIDDQIAKEQLKPGKEADSGVLNKLFGDRQKLAGQIQAGLNEVGTVNIPATLDLAAIQSQLKAPFVNPVTKSFETLPQVTQNTMQAVALALTESVRKLNDDPEFLKFKLKFEAVTGEQFDVTKIKSFQEQLAQMGKDVSRGIENSINLPNLQNQLGAASQVFDRFIQEAIAVGGRITAKTGQAPFEDVRAAMRNAFTIDGRTVALTDSAKKKFEEFASSLRVLEAEALKAAQQGNIPKLKEVFAQLDTAINTAKDRQGAQSSLFDQVFGGDAGAADQFLKTFQNAKTALTETATAVQNLKQGKGAADGVKALEQALREGNAEQLLFLGTQQRIFDKNKEVLAEMGRLPTVVQTSVTDANTKADAFSMQAIRDEHQKTIDFINQNPLPIPASPGAAPGAAPTPGKFPSRGGLINFFARGGLLSRGTDTVPAMLSPGEFVVNSKSARKFYSELISINAGMRPVYRARGGVVNNTSIGDVNVNVTTQRGNVNGRELGKQIHRELRRKTSKRF